MARLVLPYISFIVFLLLMCMAAQPGTGRTIHGDEVKALGEIAEQLGKKDWNTNGEQCIDDLSWLTPKLDWKPPYNNSLFCNCSYPDSVCHVVALILKGQDLDSVLPRSLVKLPYLTYLDLTRNFLSGNIPREWASTKLEYLNIENNLFSGMVPLELGKLVNLENLNLSANNLSGELPFALTKLTKLTELRISSNNFTGRMPDFFRSWKQLEKLEIQASGFEGPIPPSISILSNLTELDLVGEGSNFPNLSSMTGMTKLMLRSCNISGQIPTYISNMTQLRILDLSFNRLEGRIPDLGDLTTLEFIQIDLSYNNLSEHSAPSCRENLNLFKSFSGRDNS